MEKLRFVRHFIVISIPALLLTACASGDLTRRMGRIEAQNDSLLVLEKAMLVRMARLDTLEKDIQKIKLITDYLGMKVVASARGAGSKQRGGPSQGEDGPLPDFETAHQIPEGASFSRGPKDAKWTIVEFSDMQCHYCAEAAFNMDALLEKHPKDFRHVVKNFPLSFHSKAKGAAAAAIAAGKQGKYFEFRRLVFQGKDKLETEDFLAIAKSLGLDMARFKKDMAMDAKFEGMIKSDMDLGLRIGVNGTPTYFVNGRMAKERSLEYFESFLNRIDG
jgi:protein-disulfide isomerase